MSYLVMRGHEIYFRGAFLVKELLQSIFVLVNLIVFFISNFEKRSYYQ